MFIVTGETQVLAHDVAEHLGTQFPPSDLLQMAPEQVGTQSPGTVKWIQKSTMTRQVCITPYKSQR